VIKWYPIKEFYQIDDWKVKHRRNPKKKFIQLSCVYKIAINNTVVHIGKSTTCKKHGPAEKVRKAIVQLLDLCEHNPSVGKTKMWEQIRLQHKPKYTNIQIGVIETDAVDKIYTQELTRAHSYI